jgi:pimeloyl-ACP methyl ester carboxylesterase
MRGMPARPASMRAARRADDTYGKPGEPDWREVDWRAHLRDTEIDGRRLNYCDYGKGAAVVLVHGLGGSWQNWLENVRAIGLDHRVIAPDMPGFGYSEEPAGEVSIPGYARTIATLCEQLGIARAAVIGNSLGGFISAEVAIQFPELVERLCLVSAAGYSINETPRSQVVLWGRINTAVATRTAARTEAFVRRPVLRHLTFSTLVRHPTRVPQDMLYELARHSGRPGFMPALYAHMKYDFRDRVGDIACPALVVWGRDDMVVTARDADEYERALPSARKVVYEDTGHLPMVERPREFNELVREFLAGSSEPETAVPSAASA